MSDPVPQQMAMGPGQHLVYSLGAANHMFGHVPRELSKILSRFLADYGGIEAECIGVRYNRGEGNNLRFQWTID